MSRHGRHFDCMQRRGIRSSYPKTQTLDELKESLSETAEGKQGDAKVWR